MKFGHEAWTNCELAWKDLLEPRTKLTAETISEKWNKRMCVRVLHQA